MIVGTLTNTFLTGSRFNKTVVWHRIDTELHATKGWRHLRYQSKSYEGATVTARAWRAAHTQTFQRRRPRTPLNGYGFRPLQVRP